MSSLGFLVTELQSLASETRRKHPQVRDAAEKALVILRSSPSLDGLEYESEQSAELLKPIFMGCATRSAKVVAISLGCLNRLIALKAVPLSSIPQILNTMSDCISQGVDIQLRILQTLLSLITNFPAIHGDLLGDALLLCFKLQESRIAVVSSTAAATLRQLLMFVVDKLLDEDRSLTSSSNEAPTLIPTLLPNNATAPLHLSAHDVFSIFQDLCLLANSERPLFLKLDSLQKTFALELIESVLTNYHELFRKHEELHILLQQHLSPLLLKSLSPLSAASSRPSNPSPSPSFPLTLRCTRVVFLLLKQFYVSLPTETEVFLMLLVKIIGGGDGEGGSGGQRPGWMRVLAMEIMRGLCNDPELMRTVYARYDSPSQHESNKSQVFSSLITTLNRLITEKPHLLGVSSQMLGLNVNVGSDSSFGGGSSGASVAGAGNGEGHGHGYSHSIDVGGVAGMVANAASGMVGMMAPGSEEGLSLRGSAMKLQCIDQLDKADAPPIPESYIYLLGVQCLVSICDGFLTSMQPIPPQTTQSPSSSSLATDAQSPANPTQTQTAALTTSMLTTAWPPLLAALSFTLTTNLSDDLFPSVLAAYQAITTVSGAFGLNTPRDAFLAGLAKLAVPSRVVHSLEASSFSSHEPPTPRTAMSLSGSISENLGFGSFGGGGGGGIPGLSDRNIACLKVLVSSALFLAGGLGEDGWFGVLEALQNADYVLTFKGTKLNTANSNSMGKEVEAESVLVTVQRLFDASKGWEDRAFGEFVRALCKLSSEMVGMQTQTEVVPMKPILESPVSEDNIATPNASNLSLTPTRVVSDAAHRRRVSGIHLPRTLRSGDFGINKLGGVALLNVHRLIYRSPEVAWNTITNHLLSVLRHSIAPPPLRLQAARTLDDILLVIPRNVTSPGELQIQVQRRVLDVLAQQVIPDPAEVGNGSLNLNLNSGTSAEIRRMGLETLHQILLASGHTFVVGWETIFEMLGSVCRPVASITASSSPSSLSPAPRRSQPPPLGYTTEKNYTANIKIAFQSLTLVCDSLSLLSPEHLRLCISTLGQFGRQADTNIALTAAESLLWGVSDSIQAKRKEVEKEPVYSSLWMFLLLEVLGLCTDGRPEVRVGAIQTLFRSLQLYGATLSLDTWDECIWKVTFPLLDSITAVMRQSATTALSESSQLPPAQEWDESKVLALQSIGSIFGEFLISKIMRLKSFSRVWDVFLNHIQDSVLFDNRGISAPALLCLDRAVRACAGAPAELKARVAEAWTRVWQACDEIGGAVLRRGGTQFPDSGLKSFTQESLVVLVEVIRSTRDVSRALDGVEWPLERLSRLMTILKGVLTYQNSPDYRPDIDALTPLQAVVIETISDIDLAAKDVPSLVLRDLSEYVTLPFVAAFDVAGVTPMPESSTRKVNQKRITYIGICKKCMPMLVNLFLRFKDKAEIYVDGTLEVVIFAYSIPVKLKYECPAPSKFGKDPPLWKTATTSFLGIVKECGAQIKSLGSEIPDERVEGVWRQVIDVFRGGILADCSAVETFPLDVQESEENFDLALIASLEIDVVPYLGDSRIPDYLVTHLAKVLHQGSRLLDFNSTAGSVNASSEVSSPSNDKTASKGKSKGSSKAVEKDREYDIGTTESGHAFPRERFSYWCLDLLFLISSDSAKDQEHLRRRVTALSLSSLLSRCRTTLVGYVADEALRGNLPFPRVREEELLYVLRKLLELKLWAGTLWAAFSDSPSKYCITQPPIDTTLAPSELISDSIRRSSKAHLFYFYDVLCEIAAIPRRTPSAWTVSPRVSPSDRNGPWIGREMNANQNGMGEKVAAKELDARALARECLREIGREMGMSR